MADGPELASGPTARERVRAMVPWFVTLAASGAAMFALDGVERAMAVGAFGAAALGALLAVTQMRKTVTSMREWMIVRESDLHTFADDRAAAVARQFEWAVEELVSVRAELRRVDALRAQAEELAAGATADARRDAEEVRIARQKIFELGGSDTDLSRIKLEQTEAALRSAQAALHEQERERRHAEKRMRSAEHRVVELTRTLRLVATTVGDDGLARRADQAGPLTFDWTLEYDGSFHSLRLRCTTPEVRPSRARILDASGRPVAETAGVRHRRSAQLVLRIPQSVAAAVESADWSAFRLEVQVDEVWRGAVLVDRGEPVVEQPGRAHAAQAGRTPAIRIVS